MNTQIFNIAICVATFAVAIATLFLAVSLRRRLADQPKQDHLLTLWQFLAIRERFVGGQLRQVCSEYGDERIGKIAKVSFARGGQDNSEITLTVHCDWTARRGKAGGVVPCPGLSVVDPYYNAFREKNFHRLQVAIICGLRRSEAVCIVHNDMYGISILTPPGGANNLSVEDVPGLAEILAAEKK